jgi:hypothetical protein
MMPIMYEHKWKKWGVVLASIGLVLLVAERLTGFIIIQKLSADQHHSIFEWIMLLGMVMIMYSKEKQDDERAKMIRLKVFQVVFLLMISTLLAIALSTDLTNKTGTVDVDSLFVAPAFGIILYLLLFHLGLYFDVLVEYEDKTVGDSLAYTGTPRWGMLAFYICAAVSLALVYFL